MNDTLFIPVILGTNRQGRKSEAVAKWLVDKIDARGDIETKLFDVRDFRLPQDDYGQTIKDNFPEYRDAILRADGLILVTPEYNHCLPGTLKSVLDLLLPEYNHKAVGFAGVSMGPWGGTRVIENTLPIVRELGLVAIGKDLNFPKVGEVFAEDGSMQEEHRGAFEERSAGFLDELVWMAGTLREGRARGVSGK